MYWFISRFQEFPAAMLKNCFVILWEVSFMRDKSTVQCWGTGQKAKADLMSASCQLYARAGTPTVVGIHNEKHNTSIVALDKEMELKKILSQKKLPLI